MAEAQTPMAEAQWHLDADTYLAMVRSEIPTYDVLQGRLAGLPLPTGVSGAVVSERELNGTHGRLLTAVC